MKICIRHNHYGCGYFLEYMLRELKLDDSNRATAGEYTSNMTIRRK